MKNFYENDDGDAYHTKKYKKKLKLNPKGPYNVKMTFSGIYLDIIIQNTKVDEFKITVKSSSTINESTLEVLKRYLRSEGFEDDAQKWNLFWEANHYL
jgi:hypothetical protein